MSAPQADQRLDRAEKRVNAIVARLRDAHDDVKGRMSRQVDQIRGQLAEFWLRLRELRNSGSAGETPELDQALCQFETQIDIVEGRLDAGLAGNTEAMDGLDHTAEEAVSWFDTPRRSV
jgi:hypothetical protein